ncbi:MAG: hypothetical protein ABGX47_09000 [Martelella sp.]|uniref:hypothetical protein n=1 Tax=Martelella sp. TaxID=1969699 RepID=UPI0032420CB0
MPPGSTSAADVIFANGEAEADLLPEPLGRETPTAGRGYDLHLHQRERQNNEGGRNIAEGRDQTFRAGQGDEPGKQRQTGDNRNDGKFVQALVLRNMRPEIARAAFQ